MSLLYRIPTWVLAVALLAAGVLVGILLEEAALSPPLRALAILSLVPVLGLACLLYWRRIDEAAREAHKFAWYWGGSLGLAIASAVMVIVQRSNLPFLPTDMPAGELVAFGITLCMVAQVLCYGVVWVWWWLARR